MSFEDRVRSSVDQALSTLVKQVVDEAADERDATTRAGRESAFAEAEQAAQTRVADAEARVRATMDEAIAAAAPGGRPGF